MVEYEDGTIVYPMWDYISFEVKREKLYVAPKPVANYLQINVSSI